MNRTEYLLTQAASECSEVGAPHHQAEALERSYKAREALSDA